MCALISPGEYPNDPNLVLWQDWGNILVPIEDFLKILIFRQFSALQRSKFDDFCHFRPKFAFENAENHQKIKIFKIPARNFFITLKSCPDIRNSIPSAPSLHIFGLLGEIWL